MHNFSTTVLAIFFCSIGIAQQFGEPTIIYPHAQGYETILSADLDGDGNEDFVCSSLDDNQISWFRNQNGVYGIPEVISDNAEGPTSIVTVDLDADGDLDVLASLRHDNKIAWYENDGNGVFSDEITISSEIAESRFVMPADLDGDGDLDVIALAGSGFALSWFRNDGDTNFYEETPITTENAIRYQFDVVDIDSDGDLDIVTATYIGDVTWFENDGNGVFIDEHVLEIDYSGSKIVISFDVNEDSFPDLIVRSAYGNMPLVWYENDGAGNFEEEFFIDENSIGTSDWKYLDLDGDNHLDLLLANSNDYQCSWFQNDGNGNFTLEQLIQEDFEGIHSFTTRDEDNDGDLDIFICDRFSSVITVFENVGGENFEFSTELTTSSDSYTITVVEDLNSDGMMDLIGASSYGFNYNIMFNQGDGDFSFSQKIDNLGYTWSMDAADLDNDGDIDLVSSPLLSSELVWFQNNGQGFLSDKITIDNTGAWSIVLDDLNGDDNVDVLAISGLNGGSTTGQIVWFQNDGAGNFLEPLAISSQVGDYQSVFAADLDGDGDKDVLSAFEENHTIAWHQNMGGGTFSDQLILTDSALETNIVSAGDLDGDSNLDVLFYSTEMASVYWMRNTGGGNFAPQEVIVSDVLDSGPLSVIDIDADGDLDLLSVLFQNQGILISKNDGNGVFSQETIIPNVGEGGVSSISTKDIDQDGDLDIVCGYLSSDKGASWLENLLGEGCTNPDAVNFDPSAWIDNGSCCFTGGCTNEFASNYNDQACFDDGQCTFELDGIVFNDENENGVLDNQESGLPLQTITVEPSGIELITNGMGEFTLEYTGSSVESFTLEYIPAFPFNTTPSTVIFDPFDPSLNTTLDFGVSYEIPDFEISTELYPDGNGFLCNDSTEYKIFFRNMGSVSIDGVIQMEYDPLFQGHSEITPIDSVNGNTVYFSFEDLSPGQMDMYYIDLLTPTVDYIGEFISSNVSIIGFYNDQESGFGEAVFEQEITCAYDPNDKQAFPLGYTDDHLLLQETEQEFLIRFQNTGNAPAQNIRIQDTLDVNFDIETFKLSANSHSVMTTIDPETRLIDFYFEDIQLPDSINDEPNSHGLISYKITPLPNLPIGTVLENTAYIYFDNNEPIITNTTWTTIHECGGEAEYAYTVSGGCGPVEVDFNSTYPHLTSIEWLIDDELFGTEANFNFDLLEPAYFEVTLNAENPLCSATATQSIDVAVVNPSVTCIGDFNCDDLRDTNDLLSLLSVFGEEGLYQEDLDGNQMVNVIDVISFLALHNSVCGE